MQDSFCKKNVAIGLLIYQGTNFGLFLTKIESCIIKKGFLFFFYVFCFEQFLSFIYRILYLKPVKLVIQVRCGNAFCKIRHFEIWKICKVALESGPNQRTLNFFFPEKLNFGPTQSPYNKKNYFKLRCNDVTYYRYIVSRGGASLSLSH